MIGLLFTNNHKSVTKSDSPNILNCSSMKKNTVKNVHETVKKSNFIQEYIFATASLEVQTGKQ